MELSFARWKSVKSSKSGFSTFEKPVIQVSDGGYQDIRLICIKPD